MGFENTYELKETIQDQAIKYYFISNGTTHIVKAVEYRYIQDLGGHRLFNLGFGDYDLENDTTNDSVLSNNGDAYTVFHTVLSTIPKFFEANPNAVMMVQGSDSGTAFSENCKKSCRKKCETRCKNINRRINAYRGYVNKNFDELSKMYTFYGGLQRVDDTITLEHYKPGSEYDSVFCQKNKHIADEI